MHLSKIFKFYCKPSTSLFRAARWLIVWPLSSSSKRATVGLASGATSC